MKNSTPILLFMTNVGSPLALEVSTIECFGTFNGKAFVRTKSGLSHLIEGDVFQHMQRWDAALRGEQVLDVIDVQVVDESVVGSRSSVREDKKRLLPGKRR